MALKVPDEGSLKMLKILAGATTKPTSFTLRLFTDAGALADTDTSASRTTAAGGGYADITLYPEGGSAPAGTASAVGGINQIAWAQQTFTFTGALTSSATIRGYLILDNGGTVWAEENTTTFQPANNGDTYKVTPVIQLGNGTPT